MNLAFRACCIFVVGASSLAACSGGGASNASGVSSDGGAGGGEAGTSATVGPGAAASPHTPATGCRDGFVTCSIRTGAICAHLADDSAHCGSCDVSCSGGSCIDGKCDATSQNCEFGAMCGSECIKGRYENVDHCGSCFNRCADGDLCIDNACRPQQGTGASCASPLLASDDEENAGVRLGVASTSFVHPCGPLDGVPTRWMRFNTDKSSTSVALKPVNRTDHLVLSVYATSACNEAVLVGCSDDAREPKVELTNANGKTYFAALGAIAVSGSGAAVVKVDR